MNAPHRISLLCALLALSLPGTALAQLPSGPDPLRLFPSVAVGDTVRTLGKDIGGMVQDAGGNTWFASNGQGIYRYDGRTMVNFTKKHGLISDFATDIQRDVNGHLWITTRDGIGRFDGVVFTDQTENIRNAPSGSPRVTKRGLFFGHPDGVVYFNGSSFTRFAIHPPSYAPAPSNMNRPYSVYSTLVDDKGVAWFGTQSEGVARYDGGKITYVTGKKLDGAAVRSMFQDRNGIVWFGNNGGGLFRYDGRTLTNVTDELGLGNPEFLKGRPVNKPGSLARVWSINEDRNGDLWVGTIDAGAWRYNGNRWTNYTTADGLAGDAIWKIFKDDRGELWFITNGDALCRFNGKGFTKQTFR
jgi:ligand-binding sensor domain-containing protein